MNELFTLGDTLRMAREHLKMSQSDVAEATRMKVHIVDAIECNDFSRIAVPLYGKGFVKMYAECVGLDPEPLVRDYLMHYARAVRPSLQSDYQAPPMPVHEPLPAMPSAKLARKRRSIDWHGLADDLAQLLREGLLRLAVGVAHVRAAWHRVQGSNRGRPYRTKSGISPERLLRYAAIVAAVLVVLLVVYYGVGRLRRDRRPVSSAMAAPARASTPLRLATEPPPSYLKTRQP